MFLPIITRTSIYTCLLYKKQSGTQDSHTKFILKISKFQTNLLNISNLLKYIFDEYIFVYDQLCINFSCWQIFDFSIASITKKLI